MTNYNYKNTDSGMMGKTFERDLLLTKRRWSQSRVKSTSGGRASATKSRRARGSWTSS